MFKKAQPVIHLAEGDYCIDAGIGWLTINRSGEPLLRLRGASELELFARNTIACLRDYRMPGLWPLTPNPHGPMLLREQPESRLALQVGTAVHSVGDVLLSGAASWLSGDSWRTGGGDSLLQASLLADGRAWVEFTTSAYGNLALDFTDDLRQRLVDLLLEATASPAPPDDGLVLDWPDWHLELLPSAQLRYMLRLYHERVLVQVMTVTRGSLGRLAIELTRR